MNADLFVFEPESLVEIGRVDSTTWATEVVYSIPGVDRSHAVVGGDSNGHIVVFIRGRPPKVGDNTPITEVAPGLCRYFKPPVPPECGETAPAPSK